MFITSKILRTTWIIETLDAALLLFGMWRGTIAEASSVWISAMLKNGLRCSEVGLTYATALLDCPGTILLHYGRYNIKHPIWLELKSWWAQKLSGEENAYSYRSRDTFLAPRVWCHRSWTSWHTALLLPSIGVRNFASQHGNGLRIAPRFLMLLTGRHYSSAIHFIMAPFGNEETELP